MRCRIYINKRSKMTKMTKWKRALKNMKWKGIMAQMKKEKRKSKRSLCMIKGMVTPLGVMGDSKMSGEEPPLEVHDTEIKPNIESTQDSLNTLTKFFFLFKIQCLNT